MKHSYGSKSPKQKPYKTQGVFELVSVTLGLGLLLWRSPLGSEGFEFRTGLLCLAVLLYVAYRMVTCNGIAERWGFPFSQPPDPMDSLRSAEQETFGWLLMGGFFIAGAAPMLLMRLIAPQSIAVSQPASYFLWCAIQDFLFFALILRNLEDHIGPLAALVITAVLFGLSHYPYSLLMAVTAVAGGVWGYAFLETRSLILITLSHWLMGVILLS